MPDLPEGKLPSVVGGVTHPDVEIMAGAVTINRHLQGRRVAGNPQSGRGLKDDIVAVASRSWKVVLQFGGKCAFRDLGLGLQ